MTEMIVGAAISLISVLIGAILTISAQGTHKDKE